MKLKIDATPLSDGNAVRGIGEYTRLLIEALHKQKGLTLVENDSYDLIHYPYFDLFFHTLPDISDRPCVVTIHDVIPLLYPKHYKPGIRGKWNLKQQIKSLKKVKFIITDSETSKKDIMRFLEAPEKKIIPIHLASDPIYKPLKDKKFLSEVKLKYNLPDRFVLYVGDVNYNKNVGTLAKACIKNKSQLVIVGKSAGNINETIRSFNGKGIRDITRRLLGKTHPELAHYQNLSKLFESKYVRTLGYVVDEDLVGIYNLASMYCQPSLYEGFGLPPLQALACGTPVVASRTQTLVEVLEKGAVYFEPTNVEDLSDKIESLLVDENSRQNVITEGSKRLKDFSWNKTADKTLEVYKRALQ